VQDASSSQYLGLELEHFVVKRDTNEFVSYFGTYGVHYILQQLQPLYIDTMLEDGYLLGLGRPNITISLEPGAQLEVSIGKFETVEQIAIEYDKFCREINPILDQLGYQLVNLGYHPTARAQDIPLLPKLRYRYMDDRFGAQGGLGMQMMRATCATHVTIDYVDSIDFGNKYRLASLLVPILAYLTDNCVAYEGASAGIMTRMKIWQHTDTPRSGFVPHSFDPTFGLNDYSEYLLDMSPMFVYIEGKLQLESGSVADYYSQHGFEDEDTISHVLSIVFPHVRVKKYLEIRAADSLPIHQALGYVSLIKGIFYNSDNISKLLERFQGLRLCDAEEAIIQLQQHGKDAVVYGTNIQELCDYLVALAKEGSGVDADARYIDNIILQDGLRTHNKC
jgi:glutamate--cysteine ligase